MTKPERQRILVVEDHSESLLALKQVLGELDAEIILATSGKTALAATREHDFALAILDERTSEMDDDELTQHLRGEKGTRLVPFVFLSTSDADERDHSMAYRKGAVDFVVKPYDPEVLLGKVRVFLELAEQRAELQRERDRLEQLVESRAQELRAKEAVLKKITDAAEDMIFALSIDGRVTYVNAAAAQAFGRPPEDLLDASIGELFPAENQPEHLEAIGQLMATSAPVNRVSRTQFPGREVWLDTTLTPLTGEDGVTIGVLGIARDVTEKMNAEEQYQTIIRSSLDGFWLTDLRGRFLDVNDAYVQMSGYSRAELLELSITDIEANESPAESAERIEKVLESGGDRFDTRHRRKDGSLFFVEVSASQMSSGEGRIVAFLRDVTERKQAEGALLESEEKFRTLVTENEEIVYMIARDGTFLLSEGKGLAKLGLQPGQVVGASVYDLYKDFPEMLDAMKRAFNGETVVTEVDIAGNHFRSWYSPHRDRDGEIAGLLGLSVNITERKQAEETLRQNAVIVDSSTDMMALLDRNFNYLHANSQYVGAFGMTPDQLIGRTVTEVFGEEMFNEVIRVQIF